MKVTDSSSDPSKEAVIESAQDLAAVNVVEEDLVLLDRFLAGDEAAFQRLYVKYQAKVHSIATGILLDTEEAADVVQEVFTLVFRKAHRFDRRARFSTWLFRVAVNRSIQQARKFKNTRKAGSLDDYEEPLVDAEEPHVPDPFVTAAMELLSPDDRAILTLFYWDELSVQEIADSMSCTPNAAKTRLFRARERFRKHYEEILPPELADER